MPSTKFTGSRGRLSSRIERPRLHPLVFRLWFVFCGAIVLLIMAATVTALVWLLFHPEEIGRFFGAVGSGLREQRVEAIGFLPLAALFIDPDGAYAEGIGDGRAF